jgi:hypothetical protein
MMANSAKPHGQFTDQESADSGTASHKAEDIHFEHLLLK